MKVRERRQFQRPARTDEPEFLPSQGTFPARWEGRAAYDAERDVACLGRGDEAGGREPTAPHGTVRRSLSVN